MSKELDCRTCGACCLSRAWNHDDGPFADVGDDEAERIEAKKPNAIVYCPPSGWAFRETQLAMRVANGRCVALKGSVGRRVSCSIYEDRPSGCAEFEPGSEACLEIRRKVLNR